MHEGQNFPKQAADPGMDADTEPRFPWKPAVVLSTLLFLAENHSPKYVIEADLSTRLSQNQGNLLRECCYIAIALLGIVYLVRAKSFLLSWRSPVTLVFVPLLGWCVLSGAWALEPATSAKRVVAYLLMITGVAGISTSWSRKQVLQFISISGAAHLTAGVLGELLGGYFTPWIPDYRFAGTQSWNVQGFCCLIIVLSSLAASDSDPRHKVIFRSVALYGLVGLVLTRSRSSMLGVASGYLIYFLLTRSALVKVWVSLAATVSILLLYMSDAMTSVMGFLTRGGEGMDTLTGRQPLWELTLTFIRQRPFTGYGYQSFWTESNISFFFNELHWEISSTHNSYLDNLLTLGYVGLVLHVSVLVFGVVYGSFLFAKTRLPIFSLATAVCVVFLIVGSLEAVVIISPGPYAFSVVLLIWTLCLKKAVSPNAELPVGQVHP